MIIEITQTHVTQRCPVCGATAGPIAIATLQRGRPDDPDAIEMPACGDCGAIEVLVVRYDDGSTRDGLGLSRFLANNTLGQILVDSSRIHPGITVRQDIPSRFADVQMANGQTIGMDHNDEIAFSERRQQRGLPQLPGAANFTSGSRGRRV